MRKLYIAIVLGAFCLVPASASARIQGFNNNAKNIQLGMVVRQGQVERGPVQLEPASQANGTYVVGITTEAPENVDPSNDRNGIVFVETQGEVVALVAGDVALGDTLTLSKHPGFLTKGQGTVMATALEATNPARSQKLDLNSGNVTVTSIKVRFGDATVTPTDPATSALRQFGEGIADEDITPQRLAMAGLLSVATIITASVIIHGAISRALYAISRNPLAKRTILLTMSQIVIIGVVVLALGIGGAYYIIR